MPIPFEAFMQRALHDPQNGYYAKHITRVGGRGDFTTAPMLSQALGKAIASWATGALKTTGCRHLIEIGPGTGELAAQVWKNLPWSLRRKCRLHLVETSPPLSALQQQKLGRKANWHHTPQDALKACDGKAVIYSNELVDAFPCRRFEKTDEGWQELGVEFDARGHVSDVLMHATPLPESSILDRDFPIGQQVEVHESYLRWLADWLPRWQAGRLLTIDYGAESQNLYHRQPKGSIRAYLLQQCLTGPAIYDNIGRQDLTADVNFTDLLKWSEAHTTDSRLSSLGEFLGHHVSTTDGQLIDPDGAGGAFLVLDQARLSAT